MENNVKNIIYILCFVHKCFYRTPPPDKLLDADVLRRHVFLHKSRNFVGGGLICQIPTSVYILHARL